MKHIFASVAVLMGFGSAIAASLPETTPVVVNFAEWTKDDFTQNFKVENANGDESQFIFGNKADSYIIWGGNVVYLRYPLQSQANDWVITTKPVRLEAGKNYKLIVRASTYASDPEIVGAYIGTQPNASAMTQQVIAPTSIKTKFDNPTELTGTVSVSATGNYYIGVNNTNPKGDGYYCAIHGFNLSDDNDIAEPAKPEIPVVVADKSGKPQVSVRVKAPEFDVLGHRLSEVTSINLYRDGMPTGYSWTSCTPGELTAEYIDTDLTEGMHIYMADVETPQGKSPVSDMAAVYVGINAPSAPVAAAIKPGKKDGEVVISWTPSELDKDNFIQNGTVTYTVMDITDGTEKKVAENLEATTLTHQAVPADAAQKMVKFRVYAVTAGGTSATGTETPVIPAGKAFDAPVADSFANGEGSISYLTETVSGNAAFKINNRTPEYRGEAAGALEFKGNGVARITTGYINIPANGLLTMHVHGLKPGNTDEIAISALVDTEETPVATLSIHDCPWSLAQADLAALAGKKVRLVIEGRGGQQGHFVIDDLKIAARDDVNVAIESIEAPVNVKPSKSYDVTVNVVNLGTSKPDHASVYLYQDGVKVGQLFPRFSTGERQECKFVSFIPVATGDTSVLSAEIKCDGDADNSNNVSAELQQTVDYPKLPAVADLTATEMSDGSVALSWTKPSLDGIELETVVEDFESYPALSEQLPGWNLVDQDGLNRSAVTFNGSHTLPGITGEKGGFFVLDATGLDENLAAHSGSKALCSIATADLTARNEWLITPELDGSEQTISFWIFLPQFTGTCQLEYYESTTGNNPGDFTSISRGYIPSGMWRNIKVMVNEDTRYMAIRIVSDAYTDVLIDDISYRPSAAASGLEISGYNIYCDNNLLNTADLVSEESYIDTPSTAGAHKYYVSCVSNKGEESRISNIVEVGSDGIETIGTAAASIEVRGRSIAALAPGQPIAIANVDGRIVCRAYDSVVAPVAPGIYVVTAGQTTAKLIVR